MNTPRSRRRLALPALAAALLPLLIGGCGGTVVDSEKLQDTIQASLERSIHEKIQEVDCPSNQPVEPGATFTCSVTFSDQRRETATLKIRDKEADISMIDLEPENQKEAS